MDPEALPKIDLTTFILSVSSAALMSVGVRPPGLPASEETPKLDLMTARQNIDLLELIEEKTKGNLTEDETHLLEKALFEARMRFVEAEKAARSPSSGA